MAEVGEVKVKIGADTSELDRKLSEAKSSLEAFGEKISKLGRELSTAFTLPLSLIGREITKLGADYEETMQKIVGLTGTAQEQVNQWKEDILALSKAVGKTPQELAEGLYFIASAGVEAGKELDVLKASAMASAAGLGEVRTIADAVTSALNAYREQNLSAAYATSVLIDTVKYGKAEPEDLASSIGFVLPVAAQLKVQFWEVGAALASLTQTGLGASEAVTALRGVLTTILRPSAQAEKLLRQYGLSSAYLREQIKEKGLLNVLVLLAKTFRDNDEAIATIFGNVRALVGMLSLTGENAREVQKIFNNMSKTTSDTLIKAFESVENTASMKLARASATIKASLIEISGTVAPAVADAFQKVAAIISTLADWFSRLPTPVKNVIVSFGEVLVVLGPVLYFTGSLIKLFITLKYTIIGLIPKVIQLANSFLTLLSDPKTLLLVLSIGLGLLLAYQHNIAGLRDVIHNAMGTISKDISKVFSLGDSKDLLKNFENTNNNLGKIADSIPNKITKPIDQAKDLYKEALLELYKEAEAETKKKIKEDIINKALQKEIQRLADTIDKGMALIENKNKELADELSNIEIKYPSLTIWEKIPVYAKFAFSQVLEFVEQWGKRFDSYISQALPEPFKSFRPYDFLKEATGGSLRTFWEHFWGIKKKPEIELPEIKIPELPQIVLKIELPTLPSNIDEFSANLSEKISDAIGSGIEKSLEGGKVGGKIPTPKLPPIVPIVPKLKIPFPEYEFVNVPEALKVPVPSLKPESISPLILPYPSYSFTNVPESLKVPIPTLKPESVSPLILPYPSYSFANIPESLKVPIPALSPSFLPILVLDYPQIKWKGVPDSIKILLPPIIPVFPVPPLLLPYPAVEFVNKPESITVPVPDLKPQPDLQPQPIDIPVLVYFKIKEIEQSIQEAINKVREQIPVWKEQIQKALDTAKQYITIAISVVIDFAYSLAKTIKDIAQAIWNFALEKKIAIQNEVSKLVSGAKEKIIWSINTLVSFAYYLAKNISEVAKEVFEWAQEKAKEIGKYVGPVLIPVLATIGLIWAGITWLGKQLFSGGQLAPQAVGLGSAISVPVEVDLMIDKAVATYQLKQVFANWNTTLQKQKGTWENYWGNFADTIIKKFGATKEKAPLIIDTITKELLKFKDTLGITTDEQARQLAISILLWRDWGDELALHSIIPDVANTVEESLNNMTQALKENSDALKDFIETAQKYKLTIPTEMNTISGTGLLGFINWESEGETKTGTSEGDEGGFDMIQLFKEVAGEAGDRLREFVVGLIQLMTPFTILEGILSKLDAKGAFINAMLEKLLPTLNALLYPFTMLGQIIGDMLIPVMQSLWPVFKLLGITVGGILWGIAQIYNAIASAINWALGWLGINLAYIDTKPLEEGLAKLSTMTWEQARALSQANEALNDFSDGLLNAPEGFKVALAKYQAIEPVPMQSGGIITRPTYALVGEAGAEAVIPLSEIDNLGKENIVIENIYIATNDPEKFWKELKKVIERKKFINRGTPILEY